MRGSAWFAGAGVLLSSTLAFGQVFSQDTNLERFERQLEQVQRDTRLRINPSVPLDQRALIDYGGYLTFSFATIDDTASNTHILRQTDLIGYARIVFDGAHEFFARARTTYSDWNSGDSFDGHGDDWEQPTLDRAHYRFDLQRALAAYDGVNTDWILTFQGGRQLVHWANGLTLSQEIDGGVIVVGYEPVTLEIVAGVTRDSSPDIDSSRPKFDGDTHRGFYGALLSAQMQKHRPFVYGLVQQDYNDDGTASLDPDGPGGAAAVDTQFEYNSFYIGAGSRGSFGDHWLYGLELVYQGGRTLSSSFNDANAQVDQTMDSISAAAADFQLDYLLLDDNNSRLTGELLLATGDDDRQHTTNTFGGNLSGTTDQAFNAFGLVNTGLAFAPNASNLAVVRLGGSTFPLPNSRWFQRLQVGMDFLIFSKLSSDAPISEASGNSAFLGVEPDLFLNWQITSDLALAVRYGVFFPGEAVADEGDRPNDDPRHFFFTSLTFGF